MLDTVKYYNGRLGSGRLSQIMSGTRNAELVGRGYAAHPVFGVLKQLKQNVILAVLKELERKELLERCGNPEYPCLRVSRRGQSFLAAPGDLNLSVPPFAPDHPDVPGEPKKKKLRQAAAPRTEEAVLFDRLRKIRMQLAEKRRCPPFMIFGDKVLRELAKQRPMCVADAMEIRGIGQVKIHTVLPFFLREIQEWCNGH